jgi:hypothetical protein
MNFQKLFGPLTRDRFFNEIIGHDHMKRLFSVGLESYVPYNLSLVLSYIKYAPATFKAVIWQTLNILSSCNGPSIYYLSFQSAT